MTAQHVSKKDKDKDAKMDGERRGKTIGERNGRVDDIYDLEALELPCMRLISCL